MNERLKTTRNRPRSTGMTALTVFAALLLVWFASMFGITQVTAINYTDYYDSLGRNLSEAVMLGNRLSEELTRKFPIDFMKYNMWNALDYANRGALAMRSSSGNLYYSQLRSVDCQSAAAFYDGDGNLLDMSGDFFYFPYDTETVWNAADDPSAVDNTSGYAKVPINMKKIKAQNPELLEDSTWDIFVGIDVKAMRFTGVLDGTTLVANKIEYVLCDDFNNALYSSAPEAHYFDADGTEVTQYNYSVSKVIRMENVPWHTLLDYGKSVDGEVTLYTTMPSLSDYTSRGSDLLNYLVAYGTRDNIYQNSDNGLREMTVYSMSYVYDYDELIPDGEGGEIPATKYIVTAAVRFFPLKSAMKELKGLYIATGLLTFALMLAVCRKLRHKLIVPMQRINSAASNDYARITGDTDDWREIKELCSHYDDILDILRQGKNEITRLNTALDYSKKAELTRRQMTSNIAHELKTPLAVIHSYSEGLKEHIADEKREQYLDVILSESERMDAMVLEMLDLSRLEAGKVKLARDEFSINGLVKSVFDKLASLAEEKELNISFDLSEESDVIADEARMEQVVTNFAANAVQYTPHGGNVLVRTYLIDGEVGFSVENDSVSFSAEELSKVWDTFYRADKSRNKKGTGLGLAIAKSIIDLHGGKCSVKNTLTGVEFSFSLPK